MDIVYSNRQRYKISTKITKFYPDRQLDRDRIGELSWDYSEITVHPSGMPSAPVGQEVVNTEFLTKVPLAATLTVKFVVYCVPGLEARHFI